MCKGMAAVSGENWVEKKKDRINRSFDFCGAGNEI
jgi:hypothetical protein